MVSAKLVAMAVVLGACMTAIVSWYESGGHKDTANAATDDEAGLAAYIQANHPEAAGRTCSDLSDDGLITCASAAGAFCQSTCGTGVAGYSITTSATLHTDMDLDVEMYYTDSFDNGDGVGKPYTLSAVKHDGKTYLSATELGFVFVFDESGSLTECQQVTGDMTFLSDYAKLDTSGLDENGAGTLTLPGDAGSIDINSVTSGPVPATNTHPTLMGVTIPTDEACGAAMSARRRLKEVESFEEQAADSDHKRELGSARGYPISDMNFWRMSVCSNPGGLFCGGKGAYSGCSRGPRLHDDAMSSAVQLWTCGSYKVVAWEETGLGASEHAWFWGLIRGIKDAITDFDVTTVSCGAAGSTHRGFCQYVQSLEARINEAGWGPSPTTYITGWSLGGSGATVHKARNPSYAGLVSFGALKTSGAGTGRQSGTRFTMGVDPAQSNWGTWTPFTGTLPNFRHLAHDVQTVREVWNNQYCGSYVHWFACSGCSGCGWGGCSGCSGCWSYNSGHCYPWGWVSRWQIRSQGAGFTSDSMSGDWVSAGYGIVVNHPSYDNAAL